MLSDEQIQAIHHASLDILSQTGIVMKNKRAEELLLEAGARQHGRADQDTGPPGPKCAAGGSLRIPMHTRTGLLSMPLESGKVFFGTGSDCNFTIDLETGQRRPVLQKDVQAFARLCDGLENIDFVMSMGVSSDVAPMHHYIHGIVAMLRGSVKPIVFTANDLKDMQVDLPDRLCSGGWGGQPVGEALPAALCRADLSIAIFRRIGGQTALLRRKGHPGRLYPLAEHRRRWADHAGRRAGAWQRRNPGGSGADPIGAPRNALSCTG